MPKKTKKQKLLAELRRKIEKQSSNDLPVVKYQNKIQPQSHSTTRLPNIKDHKQSLLTAKTSNKAVDYSFVGRDLIKITLFTLVALVFQGVLYYLLYRL